MANKLTRHETTGLQTWVIDTTAAINIGTPAEGVVGSWTLQVIGGGSYSIVLQKKLRNSAVSDAASPDTYYINHATGVSVNAGTAITGAGLFSVPSNGCDVILDIAYTSGACSIELLPMLG